MTVAQRIARAIDLAVKYGGIDGDHHKAWVIDQMVRALCGSESGESCLEYRALVADARAGEDGPETHEWNEGTPP